MDTIKEWRRAAEAATPNSWKYIGKECSCANCTCSYEVYAGAWNDKIVAEKREDAIHIATFNPTRCQKILDVMEMMEEGLKAADAMLPYDIHLCEMAHATIDKALAAFNELKGEK